MGPVLKGVPSRAVSDSGPVRLRASPGRLPVFTPEQRQHITVVASLPPGEQGLSFSRWSLRKLADFLGSQGVVADISHVGGKTVWAEIELDAAQEPSLPSPA